MIRGIVKRFEGSRLLWPLTALSLLLLFNFFFTDGFFRIEVRDGRLFGSLIDVLDRSTPLLLVSLGMTLVIATGGVDLSVGAVMAIAGSIAAALIARPEFSILFQFDVQGSFLAAIGIALGVALAAGLCNGVLVALFDIQPIVATLILMVMGRGIAQLLTSGQIITVQNASFAFLGNGAFLGVPFTFTLVAIAFVLSWLLLRKTALGLFIEAAGDNPVAARYAGVSIRHLRLCVYGLSGLCAGLAGLVATADIQAADANNVGMYLELDAILAVVLGGTALTGGRFYLAGTVAGALLIQSVTTTILTRGVPVEYTLVVKAVVIVLICLLQSEAFRSMAFRRFLRRSA